MTINPIVAGVILAVVSVIWFVAGAVYATRIGLKAIDRASRKP